MANFVCTYVAVPAENPQYSVQYFFWNILNVLGQTRIVSNYAILCVYISIYPEINPSSPINIMVSCRLLQNSFSEHTPLSIGYQLWFIKTNRVNGNKYQLVESTRSPVSIVKVVESLLEDRLGSSSNKLDIYYA